jgi:TetR/AcrR family transcriptional repressor of nem operon
MTRKDPEATRAALLEAAFWTFYRNGYQASSLDDVVRAAGVTKGALYHHFSDKAALGYAVVDEIVRSWMLQRWVEPLRGARDPIAAMQEILTDVAMSTEDEIVRHGCPLNNLAQEMSTVDEGFRVRLERVFSDWRLGMADALRKGQKARLVRSDIDPHHVALMIAAFAEGTMSVAKMMRDRSALEANAATLSDYLETLRPGVRPGATTAA